jgi:hypothetical protein
MIEKDGLSIFFYKFRGTKKLNQVRQCQGLRFFLRGIDLGEFVLVASDCVSGDLSVPCYFLDSNL